MTRPLNFSSFVLKVASRCNLNCDYCYMYQHADQTWRNKPKCLSEHHQELFAKRLNEYVTAKNLQHVLIIYHGGEPLLFGAENIIRFTGLIRNQTVFTQLQN